MSGEAASRATLDLPGVQEEFLKAIHETCTPVVMVLMAGRPLAIGWADKNIPAIQPSNTTT
jgi:beta-glucosidase